MIGATDEFGGRNDIIAGTRQDGDDGVTSAFEAEAAETEKFQTAPEPVGNVST